MTLLFLSDKKGNAMRYKIVDTWEAPQCGIEEHCFESWEELQDYVFETEGLENRISEGYAFIEEAD